MTSNGAEKLVFALDLGYFKMVFLFPKEGHMFRISGIFTLLSLKAGNKYNRIPFVQGSEMSSCDFFSSS